MHKRVCFSKMDNVEHLKGIGWRVEGFSCNESERMFPVGIAYVVEIPEKGAQLNFIMVADQWRRQGIASEIVKACLEKWPNLQFTHGMDKRGRLLIKKCIKGR